MTIRSSDMIASMVEMLLFFQEHCSETETLKELEVHALDKGRWPKCHALFQRIRRKTLEAEKSGDRDLLVQYAFEEICAKSLYNLSRSEAPFDPDSQFWVVPFGIDLAIQLRVHQPWELCSFTRLLVKAPIRTDR